MYSDVLATSFAGAARARPRAPLQQRLGEHGDAPAPDDVVVACSRGCCRSADAAQRIGNSGGGELLDQSVLIRPRGGLLERDGADARRRVGGLSRSSVVQASVKAMPVLRLDRDLLLRRRLAVDAVSPRVRPGGVVGMREPRVGRRVVRSGRRDGEEQNTHSDDEPSTPTHPARLAADRRRPIPAEGPD